LDGELLGTFEHCGFHGHLLVVCAKRRASDVALSSELANQAPWISALMAHFDDLDY
jgi:hypothetical protein